MTHDVIPRLNKLGIKTIAKITTISNSTSFTRSTDRSKVILNKLNEKGNFPEGTKLSSTFQEELLLFLPTYFHTLDEH